ncbi:MAG: DUF2723 domain-containing protein [Bdellovibrionota bacterium]
MDQEIKSKIDRYVVLGFGLCILAVGWLLYLPNTAITPQDSSGSGLALAAISNGIITPPGYPIYALISKFFINFISGNPIAGLSILSALLQSLAAFIFFFLCFRVTHNTILAFSLSFTWMVSEPVMRTAVDVGIYPLHNLIVIFLLYLLYRLYQGRQFSAYSSFLVGTVFGIGLANSFLILLWLPFLLLLLSS